mgnify:CR=1 FL=1
MLKRHSNRKFPFWVLPLVLIVFIEVSCSEREPCSRYDIELDTDYTAGHDGIVWAFSNAAICTIYVNKQPVIEGKGTRSEVKKGDKFKVTKSQVNFGHTFQSWFDCPLE